MKTLITTALLSAALFSFSGNTEAGKGIFPGGPKDDTCVTLSDGTVKCIVKEKGDVEVMRTCTRYRVPGGGVRVICCSGGSCWEIK